MNFLSYQALFTSAFNSQRHIIKGSNAAASLHIGENAELAMNRLWSIFSEQLHSYVIVNSYWDDAQVGRATINSRLPAERSMHRKQSMDIWNIKFIRECWWKLENCCAGHEYVEFIARVPKYRCRSPTSARHLPSGIAFTVGRNVSQWTSHESHIHATGLAARGYARWLLLSVLCRCLRRML